MPKNSLTYDVQDKPKFIKLIGFAFQQVLAVLASTIAVPTALGMPINIPSAILGAGVGTIIYLLFTKFKSPVILSSSFAFVTPLANALAFGYMGITLGAIFAGLVYVLIAIIIKFVGTKWISKILPAVVIGPTVAIIGLSLSTSAVGNLVTASGSSLYSDYNLIGILCGLVTFFVIVVCSVQNKKKNLRLFPFVIGILAGYALASIFTLIGNLANVDYLKIVSWKALIDNFSPVTLQSFFTLPRLSLIEGIKELVTGQVSPKVLACYPNAVPINWIGVAEVALIFIPVAFVAYVEHIADHVNLGTIINKNLLDEEPGMTRTLLGDGVGSIFGTLFGFCPNTTYGESIGCVAITKNASIRTIITAALLLIVLSFLSPVSSFLTTIPSCIMGGACLTLYGFIAVSGFKMFKTLNLEKSKNLFIISVILITGIGGLAINIPYSFESDGTVGKIIQISSIPTALIIGVITNLICNAIEKHNAPEDIENNPLLSKNMLENKDTE